jgi:hypothetical protein
MKRLPRGWVAHLPTVTHCAAPPCAAAYRLEPLQQLPWVPSSELETPHDG